jgi:RNA polymerase sigma-70 factor (ECF subfamily)
MAETSRAPLPEQNTLLAIFLAYRRRLVRVVRGIVRRHEIDDILQETFIRSYEASRKSPIRHPRAFLVRTATNLALNHISRAENRRRDEPPPVQAEAIATGEPLETHAESAERFRVFCRAVRRLPEQCRHIFILKMVHGMSQREIAEHAQLSESTVEKHIVKALLMCREHMESTGYAVPARARSKAGVRRSKP